MIEEYINNHYGYGNPHAKFWLIGMEEGGGTSREEILRRVEIWHAMGAREVTDVVEFHNRLGMPEFFHDPVKLQRTWAQLIRVLLAAEGLPTDTASVKAYQRDHLGRHDGENCLLELLPLPSPSTGVWNYGEWTGLPYLKNRETYRQTYVPWRVDHLQNMVLRHQPKAVVYYGITYRLFYEMVVGQPFNEESNGFVSARNDNTLYVLVKHPAAWGDGANTAYFEGIGREIRSKLSKNPEQPVLRDSQKRNDVTPYGLYRCGKCGKMLMGYDFQNHITQEHRGENHGYKKIR